MLLITSIGSLTVITAVAIFLIITLVLVAVLLVAKRVLVPSGQVKVTINSDKDVFTQSGSSLLSALDRKSTRLNSSH